MKMKRRGFSLACACALTSATWMAPQASAQGARPRAGEGYVSLDKPAAVEAPAGKIEVVEFFSYMCPHCRAFEPTFEAWLRGVPKDVAVRRVPVAFMDDAPVLQRLYYSLEGLGQVERLQSKVFQAIHAERRRFSSPEAAADWVASQGVDRAQFLEQFNSFTVASKAARATHLTNAYRVAGVPALGVAGRFYTDGEHAKGMGRALQVVDYLIGEVRAGR
jgi:thiol:disulfide interchange protein DsbA